MARPPIDDSDDLPWLAEGVREERSTLIPRARLFGGMVVALALAVLVALGVYLVSGHKSDGSNGYARSEDAPLIAADAGAYKVQPTDPGGAQITGIDDSVAAVAGGRDEGSAIAADEPEEPLARPAGAAPPVSGTAPPTDLLPPARTTAAPPVAPAAASPTTLPSRAIAAAPVVAPVAAAKATPQPDAAAKTAATAPKPAKADLTPAVPKPARAKATVAAADADPLAAPPVRPVKPSADPAAGPAASGPVALQLGAFSTRDKADAAWTRAGGDGALTGLAKRIEPVERDGTTLYRLRAGGVASRDAAKALCGRIKAAGNACIVAD